MYHFSIQSGSDGVDHLRIIDGGRTMLDCHLYDNVQATARNAVEEEEPEEVLL